MRDERDRLRIDTMLHKVLDILKTPLRRGFREDAEEENPTEDEEVWETDEQKRLRYLNSELGECSDPEYWQTLHHAEPDSEEERLDGHMLESMREANAALDVRYQRLEAERDEAAQIGDQMAMEASEAQMSQVKLLKYNIWAWVRPSAF